MNNKFKGYLLLFNPGKSGNSIGYCLQVMASNDTIDDVLFELSSLV